jgi:5-methyltetrahydropteroyltriglutamate--homocysteine methyltransferase
VHGVRELGCCYLQLDDTSLAYVNDPAQREHIASIGGDPEHLHEHYIANINRALRDRPRDLVLTTHTCRGNNRSMWAAEGGYDLRLTIAEQVAKLRLVVEVAAEVWG